MYARDQVIAPALLSPAKAPPGTIRREFGRALMINAAHASDSQESARREMEIIRMGDNPLIGPSLQSSETALAEAEKR